MEILSRSFNPHLEPHVNLSLQTVTSVLRVQWPHVHQHSVALLMRGMFCAVWHMPCVPPGAKGAILGMVTPELATCCFHCWTCCESVGGALSSGG